MRHFCVFAFLAFQLLAPHQAFALSCAPPVLNAQAVDTSDLIFEGTVTDEKEASVQESKMGPTKIFTFSVTKAWKGTESGAVVEVARNTYWGDGFAKETTYLVVASKDKSGAAVAGLCGLSQRVEHADKALEFLDKHFAKPAETPK